ncbi:fructosamine kinase family protein [Vibrio lentus]|nr:fructosamine kinase family protein [Vibrio lentus]
MWQAISQQLSDTLYSTFRLLERTKVPGGDINDCYMIRSDGNERYFVYESANSSQNLKLKLRTCAGQGNTSQFYVPELVLIGKTKECSFIIL